MVGFSRRVLFIPFAAAALAVSFAVSATSAEVPSSARDAVVRCLLMIKSGDVDAARKCYVDASPAVNEARNEFISERVAVRRLIGTLTERFPKDVADLNKSKVSPFTDQGLDYEIDGWRNATERQLPHSDAVLLKRGTGTTAVVVNTTNGWLIEFPSVTHGRVSVDDETADRSFVSQERQRTELALDIDARVRRGEFQSLLDATKAYDMRLDIIQLSPPPTTERTSTQPMVTANSIVAWSISATDVAACTGDGVVKIWDFVSGKIKGQFAVENGCRISSGGLACGPDGTLIALVDKDATKSLRVLTSHGDLLAGYEGFQSTDKLPNGMIQRLIGFSSDGSVLLAAQNSDDFISWFDLGTRRAATVLQLSNQIADVQFSTVVALRDMSGLVHFHGSEAIGYDANGNIKWREALPGVVTTDDDNDVQSVRRRPLAGTLAFHLPHIADSTMVKEYTAFWTKRSKQPIRISLRTGAILPMGFNGSMSDLVAVDADHQYIITRDADDGSYSLWNSQGRQCLIGELIDAREFVFSADGTRLLALADPSKFSNNGAANSTLTPAIAVFRIGDGKCAKQMELN